jgi:Type ISP C-terminal specificity domain
MARPRRREEEVQRRNPRMSLISMRGRWAVRFVSCTVVGAVGPTVSASADPVDEVQIIFVETSGSVVDVVVALPERLTDRAVPADAFSVSVGGVAASGVQIARLDPAKAGLVLVLDTGAGSDSADLATAQGLSVEILRGLEDSTPAAVLSTTEPHVAQGLTADRGAAIRAVGQVDLTPGAAPTTGFVTALDAAVSELAGRGLESPAIVLFSSSTASPGQMSALGQRAATVGASLHILEVADQPAPVLLQTVDEIVGTLTGRYQLRIPAWSSGEASLDLAVGGLQYQARIDLRAESPTPTTSDTPAGDVASPPTPVAAPTPADDVASPPTPVAAPTPAVSGSQTVTSAGGDSRARVWVVVLIASAVAAGATVGLVTWRRRRRGGGDAVTGRAIAMASSAEPGEPRSPATRRGHLEPDWSKFPMLADLLGPSLVGVAPGRAWVVSPSANALRARWQRFTEEPKEDRAALFVERSRGRSLGDHPTDNLPGYPPPITSLAAQTESVIVPVRYAHRSFDRRWIIPDVRVLDRPNVALWKLRYAPEQIYLTTFNRLVPTTGPAIVATSLVPDAAHYNGRQGRTWPMWTDTVGSKANVARDVLDLLADHFSAAVDGPDLFAYIAGIAAHPWFTSRFGLDLSEGSFLRVPLTADAELFSVAADLGRRVLELHCADEGAGADAPGRSLDVRRVGVLDPIPQHGGMPLSLHYDAAAETLAIGRGRLHPVSAPVWTYEVSGVRVVEIWISRRLHPPRRRQSPLEDIYPSSWEPEWTDELLHLIDALAELVHLEHDQAELLDDILDEPLISLGPDRPASST